MKISDLTGIIEGETDNNDSETETEHERVAAISQLLIDKTEDANTASKLKTDAFINIINNMGVPMSTELLMDLVQAGDLENIISDVNDEYVTFNGKGDVEQNAEMTVDKARNTVDTMAKRNMRKGMKR